MATQPHHDPNRPLLDPIQLEEAGRALKQWLDRLLGHAQPHDDTEIEWEDGEPRNERRDGISPGH
jgi:hypothetical protein